MDDDTPEPPFRVQPDGGRSGGENDRPARETPSMDEVLGLLSDPIRRDVLDFLATASDPVVAVDDLVDRVVERETERRGTRPNRNDVTVALFHVHLPTLTGVGVVDYDPRSRTVRYYSDERLEHWLELARDAETTDEV